MKINVICEICGSEDIVRDAWAEWDVTTQEWVLKAVFDYARCEACDEERHLEGVELA